MINRVIMLAIVFLILTVIFFGIYMSKVEGASKKKWPLLLYLLVAGILIGMVADLGFFEFTKIPLWVFIAAQAWALAIGILHAWLFKKIIPLENKNPGNILLTIAICFFGYSIIFFSFRYYFHHNFHWLYFMPAFFFIVPTFTIIAFNNFIKIPAKVYKAWEFPAPGTLPDPSDQEMEEPIIINFEISKQCNDKRTVFKAKAPKFMELGKLYYFFTNDYNAKNPDNPIILSDTNKKRFKWEFYRTGNILFGNVHFDPENNISENRIKENMTVICERVKL